MTTRTQAAPRPRSGGPGPLLRAGAARVARLRRTLAMRRDLAKLSPAQMRDMGITEDMRREQLRRPWWHF